MASYVNEELGGNYTIDDILCSFASPGHHSTEECIATLRKLIDSEIIQ